MFSIQLNNGGYEMISNFQDSCDVIKEGFSYELGDLLATEHREEVEILKDQISLLENELSELADDKNYLEYAIHHIISKIDALDDEKLSKERIIKLIRDETNLS